MHFFGSERGLLATPTQLRDLPGRNEFVPWDRPARPGLDSRTSPIDSGPNGSPCPGAAGRSTRTPRPGAPDNTAGAYTPVLPASSSREDGDQNMTAVDLSTPPGFLASLAGVPYCPEAALSGLGRSRLPGSAEQASPACPAASQVGTAVAGAGAGNQPLYTPGQGLPRRSLQGGAAQPRGRHSRRLRSLRPRQRRRSGPRSSSTRSPPRSPRSPTRSRRSSDGVPLRAALGADQPQPPQLRPQPDQLRSVRGHRHRLRRPRRDRRARAQRSRSPTAPRSRFAPEAQPQADRAASSAAAIRPSTRS